MVQLSNGHGPQVAVVSLATNIARALIDNLHGAKALPDFSFEPANETRAAELARRFSENLDKPNGEDVSYRLDLKKKFDDACQVTAVNHLVEQMTAALDADGVPKEQRMSIISQAFMKVRQINEIGYALKSDEELSQPPETLWIDRIKGTQPLDHAAEQFKHRTKFGFFTKHLIEADGTLYNALRRANPAKEVELPAWLRPNELFENLKIDPLDAIKIIENKRKKDKARYRAGPK